MTLFRWLLSLLILLPAAAPARALDVDVTTFTLDNGMQVVVIPDHRAPVVTHMVWYRAGAADEPPGKSGVAHLLEHLMFKGTARYPDGEFSRILRANGSHENAFTTQDFTVYHQRISRDRLALVMELEADRMQNLVLTDEAVLPERDVVLEERRERTENDPSSLLGEQLDAALYTAHPYGKPVIGWMTEVSQLTRADAIDFYSQHYQPRNAILIVAGDVGPDEVRRLATRYYGVLRNTAAAKPRFRTIEPPPVAERRVIMRDERAGSVIWQRHYLTLPARLLPQREELAMMILAEILGGGTQSRLYQSLTVKQKIAAFAGASFSADGLDHGGLGIYAAPNPGVAPEDIEAAVDVILEDLAKDGVTEDEFVRSRDSAVAQSVYLLDSQAALAEVFGTALATGQSMDDVLNFEKDMRSVTIADVNAAARSMFDRKASVTGLLLPAEKLN